MNVKTLRSYTMIELLTIVCIATVLAVIAVPSYRKYVIQGKITTMISAAMPAELSVENDYFSNGSSFTNINYSASSTPFLTPNSDYITSMSISNGIITITGNASKLNNQAIILTFTPSVSNKNFIWTCSSSSNFWDYVPQQCRN